MLLTPKSNLDSNLSIYSEIFQMTKSMFPTALLMSIAVFSCTNLAHSQLSGSDDPFGAPPPAPGSGSSSSGDDLPGASGAPGGLGRNKTSGSGKEFALDGVLLTASRVRSFTVNVSTLQIHQGMMGGMGGMGMGSMGGMGGMMGGGMDGGYGGAGEAGGEGSDGYGGMVGGMGAPGGGGMQGGEGGMGMGGGMGGMSGGMGMGSMGGMSDMRVVVAFIMDDEKVAGRTRIEVLAPQGSQGNYVRLESLSGARPSKAKADKKAPPLWSPGAAKLIKDTICLMIWKEDAIKTLKNEEGKGEQAAASEKLLKEVLSEEYDTQLERQRFELVRLEERLKRIQDEFTRRKQAKDRVIDVQLGKIILEAQGILGDNGM
jgi:hypothetical protein